MPLCFRCHSIFPKQDGIKKPTRCPACRKIGQKERVTHINRTYTQKKILELEIVLEQLKKERGGHERP